MSIENTIRLLACEFKDTPNVEKILVTVRERFEVNVTTLYNTMDLSEITLKEMLNSLEGQEKRMVVSEDGIGDRALAAKHECSGR